MRDDHGTVADPDPETLELATRFRAARRLAEVTQVKAAAQLKTSRSTLIRIERGESPLPALYVAWAINEWNAPPWLLPAGGDVRGDPDAPALRLLGLARRERKEAEGESLEERGSS